MGVTNFARSRLARKRNHQSGSALGQTMQDGEDIGGFFEAVQSFSTIAQLAGSLGTTKQQLADNGSFATGEVEHLLQVVLVFGNATVGAARRTGQLLIFKSMEGFAHLLLLKLHHWISIAFLVAGVDQGVERKRIVLGSRNLFFDERTKDARFSGSEKDCHKSDPEKSGRN